MNNRAERLRASIELQTLETRRLMAATANYLLEEDGTLTVNGSDNADTIKISASPGSGRITLNGSGYDLSRIHRVLVFGNGGDDQIELYAVDAEHAEVHGGDGNDQITVSNQRDFRYPNKVDFDPNHAALSAEAYGEAGDDRFIGTNGATEYSGGDGNDVMDYGPVNTSTFKWIGYRYIVEYRPQGVTVTVDDVPNDGRQGRDNVHSDIEQLIGSRAADKLTAGAAPMVIDGFDGADTIIGSSGYDTLTGGKGIDSIVGGGSEDFVDGVEHSAMSAEYGEYVYHIINKTSYSGTLIKSDGVNTTIIAGGAYNVAPHEAVRWVGVIGDKLFYTTTRLTDSDQIYGSLYVLNSPTGTWTEVDGFTGVFDSPERVVDGQIYIKSTLYLPLRYIYYITDGVTTSSNAIGFPAAPQVQNQPPSPSPFSLVNGVLKLQGAAQADVITVKPRKGDPDKLEVTINWARHLYSRGQITSLLIEAGDGNDTVNVSTGGIRADIFGGGGNDTVYGSQQSDRINGGDGDDWISGLGGNDTIYGNAGNDKLFGGDGKDYLNDTSGTSVFRSGDAIDRIIASIGLSDIKGNKGDAISLLS